MTMVASPGRLQVAAFWMDLYRMSQGNSHKMMGHPSPLSGWGRTSPSATNVAAPQSVDISLYALLTSNGPGTPSPGDPFVPVDGNPRALRTR